MSRWSDLKTIGHRLYSGEVEYDFVGRSKRWYAISLAILVISVGGLLFRGLHYGIEFEGGAVFTVQKAGVSTSQARHVVEPYTHGSEPIVQKLGGNQVRIQIGEIETGQANEIKTALATGLAVSEDKIDAQVVGPSWGEEISRKALTGLIIFMILVVLYLAIAFEWRMALAALVALVHDIVITVGVYALVGFEVTPGTVIGLLTILGYSLYDTVVVFDGVKENTRTITRQNRMTYSDAANRGLNQTLVRSINTTIVALLPVGALLFVGGGLLGAGMLKDIALSLFVGLTAGAFSSIFIATPLLADLKERDPEMKALAKRVAQRKAADQRAAAKAKAEAGASGEIGALGEDDDRDEDPDEAEDREDEPAGAGAKGTRRQPVRRDRSRNRPSGRRKH
jgi:preprotein translocase subunit SecF